MKGSFVMKWLRDGLIILLITGVMGCLIEAGVRVFIRLETHSWPVTEAVNFDLKIRELLRLYRRHPFLNTAPREGTRVATFGKTASLNSLGYRSPERELNKATGKIRVLCSGGSTTFDTLAENDARTWPWEMEEILREGADLEVFNAGFPGWCSLENLISLEIRDVDLKPDIVVLFQGINDLQPAAHRPFDRQYEHGHAERCIAVLGFNRRRLPWFEHSLFFEKSRNLILGRRNFWKWGWNSSPPDAQLPVIPEEALRTFERNIRSYIAIAQSNGAEVILATQTIRLRRSFIKEDRAHLEEWIPGLDPDSIPSQLDRMNSILRKLSTSESVSLADVAGELPLEDADFGDPMHFSTSGSEKMAEFMARSIEKVLLKRKGLSTQLSFEEIP